jgi:hypothetical protein
MMKKIVHLRKRASEHAYTERCTQIDRHSTFISLKVFSCDEEKFRSFMSFE